MIVGYEEEMPRKKKRCKSGGGWIDFIEDALDGALRGARIYEKAAKLKRSIDKASSGNSPQIQSTDDTQSTNESPSADGTKGDLEERLRRRWGA